MAAALLIATNNEGKMREYREMLRGLPVDIVSPKTIGCEIAVDECGESFVENAVLKATAYARESRMLTMADDSGLEVDALGGAPGVLSARYAGPSATDAERNALLLHNMRGVPRAQRGARFRCAVALANPDGNFFFTEGHCSGFIAEQPSGSHGFGYDAVFVLPNLGKTLAEVSPIVKDSLSHRSHALRAMIPILRRFI